VSEASRRLLREVGRARMHNLRGNLNMAALGLELIEDGEDADRTAPVRRAVDEAGRNVTGLDGLILETTEPARRRLPDAAAWAIETAAPVADRRALDVTVPTPVSGLPAIDLPEGASTVIGYVLVEAYLDAARRSSCVFDIAPGGADGFVVDWTPETDAGGPGPEAARQALAALLVDRGRVTLTRRDGRRRLALELAARDDHVGEAAPRSPRA
jgi:hypothetical protein